MKDSLPTSRFANFTLWIATATITAAVVFWAFAPMLNPAPFEFHTLLGLEHAARHGLKDFFAVGNAEGLRLLAYYSVVVQMNLSGLSMPAFQTFNVASIVLALLASAAYAYALTRRVATILILVPTFFSVFIWFQTVDWILGRQETLMLLFAASAMAVFHFDQGRGWQRPALTVLLLTLGALAKETGMVAMVYVAVVAAFTGNQRRYLVPAILAFVVVIGIRQAVLGHHYAPGVVMCEQMAFVTQVRQFCVTINLFDMQNLQQVVWNAFLASYLSVVPQVFDRYLPSVFHDVSGVLLFSEVNARYVVFALYCIACSIFTLVRNPRVFLCAMLLIGLNALVLASLWRLRNMGLGLLGGITLLSYGTVLFIEAAASLLTRRAIARAILGRAGISVVTVGLLFLSWPQAVRFRAISEGEWQRRAGSVELACAAARGVLNRPPHYDPAYVTNRVVVADILAKYGVELTRCPGLASVKGPERAHPGFQAAT